jgi:hypothetical protein
MGYNKELNFHNNLNNHLFRFQYFVLIYQFLRGAQQPHTMKLNRVGLF